LGQAAADAYRELRHIQHRARLNEAPTQIDAAQAEPLAAPVRALWAHVLGG
jgi:glutamate-ammonia-ligase adenylyltransferase